MLSSLHVYPGYSGLVQYGHRLFLATALGFALLVNLFLTANFYWTALLTPWQRNLCLAALFGMWIILTLAAAFWTHRLVSALATEQQDGTFQETLGHYLRSDWFAAESQMLPYLKKYPKDVEMLLLQATMYRRTERYEEALLVLDKLQLLEDCRYWHAEIDTERALNQAAMESA